MTPVSAPLRPAVPPRPPGSTTRVFRPRAARPNRPAALTPPDTLMPRFSHAATAPPHIGLRAPRPSSAPFNDLGAGPAGEPALIRPATGNSSWLGSPICPPVT
jgi:hypothetical protein